jgi:hypothetical protein
MGVITDFPDIIAGMTVTLAPSKLFDVCPDEEYTVLREEQLRALFHHSVARLLFASARTRKDIQPTVAFLPDHEGEVAG